MGLLQSALPQVGHRGGAMSALEGSVQRPQAGSGVCDDVLEADVVLQVGFDELGSTARTASESPGSAWFAHAVERGVVQSGNDVREQRLLRGAGHAAPQVAVASVVDLADQVAEVAAQRATARGGE